VAREARVEGAELDGYTIVTANSKEALARMMLENQVLRWEKPRVLTVKRA
jgi:hypothetical protein